jgi:hypothetical protein
VKRVLRENLKSEWSDLEPHFDKFLARCPFYNKHKMIAEVLAGEVVLWRWDTGFVIGRPIHYHNKEVFFVEAVGGEGFEEGLAEWHQAEEEIRAWGFDCIEFCGRKGWKPSLEKLGFIDENVVTMRKCYG